MEDEAFSPLYELAQETEKERHLADGRVGGGGGGAQSYGSEEAWSSVNHSILLILPFKS